MFIYLEDNDGLGLELVFNRLDARKGFTYGNIPAENSIKGFYGITLSEEGCEKTAGLLTSHMDHELVSEKGNRFRYLGETLKLPPWLEKNRKIIEAELPVIKLNLHKFED